MRLLRIAWFSAGVPALVLCALLALLSGCGSAPSVSVTPTPTSTELPTTTPLPSPTVTPGPVTLDAVAGCQLSGRTLDQFVAVGALKVSPPSRVLDYPSEQIPSNAPSAPYEIAASQATGSYHPTPPTNPTLQYFVTICNTTGATHSVSGVTVNIAGYTPSGGAVNEWNPCDGPYDTATHNAGGGCGGGIGGPGIAYYSATMSSDSVGATATLNPTNGSSPIPFSLKPNTSISLVVLVGGVTSQGTYSLTFGLSVDGAASTALAPSDGSFFIAPAAVKWTGTNCETTAMLAQIPPSSQATYYVCPA